MTRSFLKFAGLIAVAAAEECYLPLDVMFLQDTTGSFEDDLPIVLKQIPNLVNELQTAHPKTWFGVAEFKDKPYFPLGEDTDFCYKLGDGKLSPEMEDFQWAYSLLYASGGADLPEAQFQALINIALDPLVGWRPLADSRDADEHEAGARIVIMSTDAPPHLPGDIMKYNHATYPDLPTNPPANSGTISTGDVDYECLFQDYPSDLQLAQVLKQQNIHLVILTPNQANITGAWNWVNEDLLGQPEGFYQFIEEDSSDILEAVLAAVASVTEYACPPQPLSTESVETLGTIVPPETGVSTAATQPPASVASTQGLTTAPPASVGLTTAHTEVTLIPSVAPSVVPTTPKPEVSNECKPCPPCEVDPCPPCVYDPCNHGVIIKIGDKPKKVSLTIQ